MCYENSTVSQEISALVGDLVKVLARVLEKDPLQVLELALTVDHRKIASDGAQLTISLMAFWLEEQPRISGYLVLVVQIRGVHCLYTTLNTTLDTFGCVLQVFFLLLFWIGSLLVLFHHHQDREWQNHHHKEVRYFPWVITVWC